MAMGENYMGGFSGQALELALRLPPLYLMDTILLQEMGLLSFFSGGSNPDSVIKDAEGMQYNVRLTESGSGDDVDTLIKSSEETWEDMYYRLYGNPDLSVLPYLANLSLGLFFYLGSAFVITLNLRQLIVFYAYFIALLCLPVSYVSHCILTETLDQARAIGPDGDISNAEWFLHKYVSLSLPVVDTLSLETRAIFVNYLVQSVLGLVLGSVLRLHFDRAGFLVKTITISMLSPNLFALLNLPQEVIEMTVNLSMILPVLLSVVALSSVMTRAIKAISSMVKAKKQFIANFGLNTFLETEWARLQVPSLLRIFWLTRIGLHLTVELFSLASSNVWSSPHFAPILWEHSKAISKRLLVQGSETLISVLGMTSIVSSICHYVGSFFHLILSAEEEDEKSVATVSAILFFVLALQTGLTTLEPDKRFARLCKNLCLLLTALFHFIHNMVSPVLMGLSANQNNNAKRHIRALLICGFLVVSPLLLMTYLWQSFAVGTWLLAVSAFCVEVIVKVSVTISVYLLFLYDQYYQEGTWELLDDAVYYVKAVGNSVEFCFAVFLFFNGGWILLFESGGAIRAIMMLIHAYCNIWLEAKTGWQTFIKRRTAVAKINSLPDASEEELSAHNDVCPICYQEMVSAKVTKCKHFFHGVCLRKWLYLQDSCPLCHAVLYQSQTGANDGSDNVEVVDLHLQMRDNDDDVDQEELIDNDEVDADLEEETDEEEEEEQEVNLRVAMEERASSTSEEDRSDLDLIYDSMEDFGASSSDEMLDNDLTSSGRR